MSAPLSRELHDLTDEEFDAECTAAWGPITEADMEEARKKPGFGRAEDRTVVSLRSASFSLHWTINRILTIGEMALSKWVTTPLPSYLKN